MENSKKLSLLRPLLLFKVIVTFFGWGLPALLAPTAILPIFGITLPDDPIFFRLFGAVVTAAGVAYWYAYKDPVRNIAILKFGVVDNGLVTLTFIAFALTSGLSSLYFWISGLLTAFFCIGFLVLMPEDD